MANQTRDPRQPQKQQAPGRRMDQQSAKSPGQGQGGQRQQQQNQQSQQNKQRRDV